MIARSILILTILCGAAAFSQEVDLMITSGISTGAGPSSKFGYSFGIGAAKNDRAALIDLTVSGNKRMEGAHVTISALQTLSRLGVGLGVESSIVPSVNVGLRATVFSNGEKFIVALGYGRHSGLGLWVGLKW